MNERQAYAFEQIKEGNNILLTGSSGTGKSYLLKYVKNWANTSDYNIAICSTTGSSALLINGKTLHSYLGIGLAKKSPSQLYEDLRKKNIKILQRILKLDILVIDEISMVDTLFFEKVNEFLQIVRENNLYFGGIQLIFSGDFCQLPPVNGDYCFKSDIWKNMNIQVILLTKIMRQDDPEFIDILEKLKWGNCTPEIIKKLKTLKKTVFPDDGIEPTILYCKNVDVDSINIQKYNLLLENNPDRKLYKTYYSNTSVGIKYWAQSLKIPETVDLCIGAQVMVTWNVDLENDIANGSRGIVIKVNKTDILIRLINGREVLIPYVSVEDDGFEVSFMPLKLAYAITIHKSQGATIDRLIINIEDCFADGQAYVAISRARNLENMKIVGAIKASVFKCNKDVYDFYHT
jgi:ATP-dependent DNA helicase PIF1